ncbi:MAG TPA: hypothetical protein VFQ54_01610, partial [Thermomicrobiales bacterium]|nr:hypothetical protein [Thermomicrobiales bacterium]
TIAVYRKTPTSNDLWLPVFKGNDLTKARTALDLAANRADTTEMQTIGVWGRWGADDYTDIRSDISADGEVVYKIRNAQRSDAEHRPIYQTLVLPDVLPVIAVAAKAA